MKKVFVPASIVVLSRIETEDCEYYCETIFDNLKKRFREYLKSKDLLPNKNKKYSIEEFKTFINTFVDRGFKKHKNYEERDEIGYKVTKGNFVIEFSYYKDESKINFDAKPIWGKVMASAQKMITPEIEEDVEKLTKVLDKIEKRLWSNSGLR